MEITVKLTQEEKKRIVHDVMENYPEASVT